MIYFIIGLLMGTILSCISSIAGKSSIIAENINLREENARLKIKVEKLKEK